MPIQALDPAKNKPAELVFGLVAAVGTPLAFFVNILKEALRIQGYSTDVVHISSYTSALKLDTPRPTARPAHTKMRTVLPF